MIKPPLDELMPKVDSKYTLVVVCAKIARKFTENEQPEETKPRTNPVSLALHEIAKGQVSWERTKIGIK
ncbi:MAG: DNA-directed RNA polymerase subunit omega [Bacillota bacterium]|nr:DNA-directed RNA polymerase subunit omega [Clostridia bacterium]